MGGTNPTLSRQCGPRLAVFFTRLLPFTPEDLSALDRYVTTIQRPPNRYRPLWAPLTPAQRRARDYERTTTNGGNVIPENGRCISCHPAPTTPTGNCTTWHEAAFGPTGTFRRAALEEHLRFGAVPATTVSRSHSKEI